MNILDDYIHLYFTVSVKNVIIFSVMDFRTVLALMSLSIESRRKYGNNVG